MDLFKEAIADAKAVREIAQKNAISTLTEAFNPQMQSLLSRKLAEEEMEDDEELDLPIAEEEMEDETQEEMPPAAPAEETPAEAEPPAEDEEDFDLDEVLAELEGDEEMEEDPITEEEDETMTEPEPEVDDESIDEILREVEDELAAEEACDDEEEVAPTMENIQLKRKLKEAYKVINAQKTVLNEVGVLNAKLLYTTKILGKHELSESQKIKILEAFDRCNNLRETKLVYSTISQNLSSRKSSKNTTKKITEGAASKAIKSISNPINENTSGELVVKNRWKKLAGIE